MKKNTITGTEICFLHMCGQTVNKFPGIKNRQARQIFIIMMRRSKIRWIDENNICHDNETDNYE